MNSPKILVAVPVHGREAIVKACLPTLRNAMAKDDCLAIYDDGNELDFAEWLCDQADEFSCEDPAIGIERQRRQHFYDFERVAARYTHLYLTDSDAIHDPMALSALIELQGKIGGAPICGYNTKAHEGLVGNLIKDDPDEPVIWRRVAPGISYLLTREQALHVAKVIRGLPDPLHWDWTVPAILGGRFATTRVSYVDHIGWMGLHHKAEYGIEGGDRATSPTPWLVAKRAEIVKDLQP